MITPGAPSSLFTAMFYNTFPGGVKPFWCGTRGEADVDFSGYSAWCILMADLNMQAATDEQAKGKGGSG